MTPYSEWTPMSEHTDDRVNRPAAPQPARRRRSSSGRRGPLFPTIWFSVLGINWMVLTTLAVIYLRPHPLSNTDYAVWAVGGLVGFFYFWVAYAVYRRRRYIL